MQNETTENKNPIDLNEIVFLFWDKAAADQDTPYFWFFVKAHDQIFNDKNQKYSNDIQKMNLEGMVPEKNGKCDWKCVDGFIRFHNASQSGLSASWDKTWGAIACGTGDLSRIVSDYHTIFFLQNGKVW